MNEMNRNRIVKGFVIFVTGYFVVQPLIPDYSRYGLFDITDYDGFGPRVVFGSTNTTGSISAGAMTINFI